MGKIVRGDYLDEKSKKQYLFEIQNQISKELNTFNNKISTIINKKPQIHELIYAGGDDVFVALNLTDAFQIAKEIRESFPSTLGANKNVTASAGIVIAHYKTPLSYVLSILRSAEEQAKSKNRNEKNAVTIVILTHTGQKIQETFKWNYVHPTNNKTTNILEIINAITNQLKTTFTSNFIYTLQQEYSFLLKSKTDDLSNNISNKTFQETKEGILLEFQRLLHRSYPKNMEPNLISIEIKKLINIASIILEHEPFQNFINLLLIADFLNRKVYK